MKTHYKKYYKKISQHYDNLAANGPYGTLAPHNAGGRKSQYVASIFDQAILHPLQTLIRDHPMSLLLDMGCGTGIFSQKASYLVNNVVGVDISLAILQVATRVCSKEKNTFFLQVDGTNLPFSFNQFDAIIARESLCYVCDELFPDIIRQLHGMLKPEGYFLWLEQVSNDTLWQKHTMNAPLSRRSPSKIINIATEAGFELIDEYIIRTPRFPLIYPVWFGLFPKALIPKIAKFEIQWHKKHPIQPRRWWNHFFILSKR